MADLKGERLLPVATPATASGMHEIASPAAEFLTPNVRYPHWRS